MMEALMISRDADRGLPLYEQLYRHYVEQIHTGRLRPGEKLPSKRALCGRLAVSMSTVETAYDLLVGEGYLTARPRSGYYVSDFVAFDGTPASPVLPAPPEQPARPALDLSTGAVDVSLFPYASWAKLYKEVVYTSPELLQRGDRQGDRNLRQALTALLREYRGVNCVPEQIVVGAGMEYLMGLLVRLFDRQAVFGMEDPGYPTIYGNLLQQGRQLCFLPLDAEGMSPEALERSGTTVAYVTPSHQFPMGITMPAGRRSQLLRWAASAPERWLIEDDYDSEFRYTSRPLPSLQGMDSQGRVIYVGTFSRSLAPSIRLAYMVLPPVLLERYRQMFGYRHSTVSRYEQAVMARFLQEGYYARYLRRVGNLYRGRRAALLEALEGIEGVTLSGTGGGIHFLLRHSRLSEPELCARALEHGVAIRGLSAYAHRVTPRPNTLVVGYGGLEDAGIPRLAETLRAAWR